MNKVTITPKDRVLKTICGAPLDKLPVNIEFTPPLEKKYAAYLGMKAEDLKTFFGNHIIYSYLNDEVKRESGLITDNWGVSYDEIEGATIRVHPLENKENIKKYIFPDPIYEPLMDKTKNDLDTYGDKYFVTSYQRWLLFERAAWLRGVENFLLDMVSDLKFTHWLLDRITEYQIEIAKRYVELGVDCGRTGDDWGGQSGMLFSPLLWRQLIKPRLQKIWDIYHQAGLPVIHHSCGDIRPIVPDLIEMGLEILHPVQSIMPREELKKRYGANLVFYGGIDTQRVLAFGSPSDVYNEVSDCIRILGENGGYVIGLGHTLTSETPFENINALVKAVGDLK